MPKTRRQRAHFLHIGKTGGTAVADALSPVRRSGRFDLQLHTHSAVLADVPRGEFFFFGVRDPVARFVSAFYSRQRRGQPRYLSPWSEGEAAAFAAFRSADGLAAGLTSADSDLRAAAHSAMISIEHVRDNYSRWLTIDELEERRGDLLMILFQERLDGDFADLARMLAVSARLPTDDVRAHRNPANVDKRLSATALENLRSWYRADFEFIDACRRIRRNIGERPGRGRRPVLDLLARATRRPR